MKCLECDKEGNWGESRICQECLLWNLDRDEELEIQENQSYDKTRTSSQQPRQEGLSEAEGQIHQ